MNRCVFLDARGRRCRGAAQEGDVFCRAHAPRPAGDAAPAEQPVPPPEAEPIEFPTRQRFLRRFAAAVLLAFFLFQMYLVLREIWRQDSP